MDWKVQIRRAKKALNAAISTLGGEIVVLLLVGEVTRPAFSAAVALAVAAGWAVYAGKNRLPSAELRRELEEALREGR